MCESMYDFFLYAFYALILSGTICTTIYIYITIDTFCNEMKLKRLQQIQLNEMKRNEIYDHYTNLYEFID